jgi:hypothetical protein
MRSCWRQVTAAPVEPIVKSLEKEQGEVAVDAANDMRGTKIKTGRTVAIFFIVILSHQ